MKYKVDNSIIEIMEKNRANYYIFNKNIYIVDWLLFSIKQFMLDNIEEHWNILQLFNEKKTPYYLISNANLYINMKNILIDYQKNHKKYSIPFLINFVKTSMNIELKKRKNIYQKEIKKNMIYSILPHTLFNHNSFWGEIATKLLKIYAITNREVMISSKEDILEKEVSKYIVKELILYRAERGIWKNIFRK